MIHLSRREFFRIVRQAYRELPSHVRDAMVNVDISVEDWPDRETSDLVEEGGTLFGLYTGVPLTEREGVGNPLPDRIIIYRQPILHSCASREEAAREIRVTLMHEVGHCLGMSEADLHRMGYG